MNFSWLRVFRIREVLPGVSPILIAALDTQVFLPLQKLSLAALGFLGIYFSAFLINELVDSFDTDKFSPEREKGITKHGVSRRLTLAAFIVCAVTGILLLTWSGLAWVGLVGFLILFIYSAPPLRLKSWPFVELAAVTFGCALLPYIAYYLLTNSPFTWREALILLFFATGFPAIQLVNEGADFLADKQAKITTTVVFLGEKKNLILIQILSFICIITGLLATIVTGHWWYLYIIAIIFFLFTAARWGLKIRADRGRLHELLRTGEKFGVFVSDLGTIIVLIIFAVFYGIKLV